MPARPALAVALLALAAPLAALPAAAPSTAAPATAAAAAAPGDPAAKARAVTVASYNIHHGVGVDGRLDLERIAREVRATGADVVGLQEVDRHWGARSDFRDQAAELARMLRMHVVYGANLDLDPLEPGQPRRQYGTAVLSDRPILEHRNTFLPRSEGKEQRGLLEVLVNVRGVPLRVFNTHLQHDSQAERLQQVAAVREIIGAPSESVVLVGDLNAQPGTPEIAGLLEDLVDAWEAAGVGDGSTFPAEAPDVRIDYVMHSDDVVARTAAVVATDASDHLPVVAELALPGAKVGIGRSGRPA